MRIRIRDHQRRAQHKVKCLFKPGSRNIGVPEFANLTGLDESTTYYWRIHASNEHGTINGEEKSFTTLPTAPHANTEPAEDVKHTQATLTGFVTPNDSEVTQCFFEWGTDKESLTEARKLRADGPHGWGTVRTRVRVGEPRRPRGKPRPTTTVWSPRTPSAKTSAASITSRRCRQRRTPTAKARSSSNAPQPHCGVTQGRTASKVTACDIRIRRSRRTSPKRCRANRSVPSAAKPGKKSKRR